MGLDSRYVLAPSLQEFFIDKDSGLPMSGGSVYFFKDNARNIPKPVFEISGNPPNYSYTVLPNPVLLSAVGTFQDASGNDIKPYYFPFDAFGNIELYFIEVFDSDGVLQFTREGWPNTTASSVPDQQDVTNFVPNGQFLLHNNIPPTSSNNFVAGEVSQPVTTIAQGGWTFERSSGSVATDIITFPEYTSITSPSGNPRYAVEIQTTVPSPSDTRKDLCLKFPGVNTFASTNLNYNYYFEAQSLTGGNFNVQIIVRKFFGTGGSPSATSETVIGTVTLTSTVSSFNTNILFGINTSSILGTNNDDYVQIVLRLPPGATQSGLFTDFALTNGEATLLTFPVQSEAQQLAPSTAGWFPTPDPNGFDLYLPAVLTQSGLTYDHSQVGVIVGKTQTKANAVNNELLLDGSTFTFSSYSSLGVPFARLGNYLILNSPSFAISTGTIPSGIIPLWGTGSNFVTLWQSTTPGNFYVNMNTTAGGNSANVQSSGFTLVSADPLYTFTVPAVPMASTFFSFTTATGGAKVYNVWFSVNGVGTAPPLPSGANIPVALVTADTIATTIAKIQIAINQYQFALIDARGYFFRGLDPSATIDPDVATRTISGISFNSTAATGADLGSSEAAAFLSHIHAIPVGTGVSTNTIGNDGASNTGTANTSATGGNETRPINLAVNWFIKY